MSARKQPASITRAYEPTPNACIRALEILLKAPVHREGGFPVTAPDNAKVRSKHDSRAR